MTCGLATNDPATRCKRTREGQPFDPALDCLQCWMYDCHPGYRAKFGGQPPSLMAKVASAAKAAGKFLTAGMPLAPEAVLALRIRACEGDPATPACEHFKPGALSFCKKCGCNLNIKRHLMTEKCPIGKW